MIYTAKAIYNNIETLADAKSESYMSAMWEVSRYAASKLAYLPGEVTLVCTIGEGQFITRMPLATWFKLYAHLDEKTLEPKS